MKQGEENTKFIKEPEEKTRDFIFQKNKKTVITTVIIIIFLVGLIIGLISSGILLES